MRFRELDPEVVRGILDATDEKGQRLYKDMLAPEALKEDAFFRNSLCPKCGDASHETFVDPRRPFLPGALLPNRHLRCLKCQTEFDPHTGLVIRTSSG